MKKQLIALGLLLSSFGLNACPHHDHEHVHDVFEAKQECKDILEAFLARWSYCTSVDGNTETDAEDLQKLFEQRDVTAALLSDDSCQRVHDLIELKISELNERKQTKLKDTGLI